jgi:hypothetical protein
MMRTQVLATLADVVFTKDLLQVRVVGVVAGVAGAPALVDVYGARNLEVVRALESWHCCIERDE